MAATFLTGISNVVVMFFGLLLIVDRSPRPRPFDEPLELVSMAHHSKMVKGGSDLRCGTNVAPMMVHKVGEPIHMFMVTPKCGIGYHGSIDDTPKLPMALHC